MVSPCDHETGWSLATGRKCSCSSLSKGVDVGNNMFKMLASDASDPDVDGERVVSLKGCSTLSGGLDD